MVVEVLSEKTTSTGLLGGSGIIVPFGNFRTSLPSGKIPNITYGLSTFLASIRLSSGRFLTIVLFG